jgi:hypothetical protein
MIINTTVLLEHVSTLNLKFNKIKFIANTEYISTTLYHKGSETKIMPLSCTRTEILELNNPCILFKPTIRMFVINNQWSVSEFEVID